MLSQKTTLGQYLDPIADKLLLSTLFVVLTHVGLIPQYVTVLVFSRDVGILLISTLLYATNALRDFRPSFFGKLNTVAQILALIAVLCQKIFISTQLSTLRDVLVASSRRAGSGLGGPIRVDCHSQDECAACCDSGLESSFVGRGFGQSLFFFDCDVVKLCGIKDFTAVWHSTNSTSSSRATTLTMGCLQLAVIIGRLFCECYGFCPPRTALSTEFLPSF